MPLFEVVTFLTVLLIRPHEWANKIKAKVINNYRKYFTEIEGEGG